MRTPATINAVQCQMIIDILQELADKAQQHADYEKRDRPQYAKLHLRAKDCYAYAAGLLLQERAKNEEHSKPAIKVSTSGWLYESVQPTQLTRAERLAEQTEDLKTHGIC